MYLIYVILAIILSAFIGIFFGNLALNEHNETKLDIETLERLK